MPRLQYEYSVEKNIPMPPRWRGPTINRVFKVKYPFLAMKVAESFFVPKTKMSTISASLAKYNKEYAPKTWSARKADDGVRVWRIK